MRWRLGWFAINQVARTERFARRAKRKEENGKTGACYRTCIGYGVHRAASFERRRCANFPNNFQQRRAPQRAGTQRARRRARERKHEIAFKTLLLGRGGESLHTSLPHTSYASYVVLHSAHASFVLLDTDARRCMPHVWPQWRVSLELKAPGRKKITPGTCSARHPSLPPSSSPPSPPAYAKLPFSPGRRYAVRIQPPCAYLTRVVTCVCITRW